jgi:hypothetical protein
VAHFFRPSGSKSRASSTVFAAASRVIYRPRRACDGPDFFGHVGGSLGMAQVGVEEPGWVLGPYPTVRSNPMWVNYPRAKDTISGLPAKKPKAARRPDRT